VTNRKATANRADADELCDRASNHLAARDDNRDDLGKHERLVRAAACLMRALDRSEPDDASGEQDDDDGETDGDEPMRSPAPHAVRFAR